jgi:hypothetical protein
MKKGKFLVTIQSYDTFSCYICSSSNWQCSGYDLNVSPSAGPFQGPWSLHNIRSWSAVCGVYTHRERCAGLFNCRFPAELCIATYNMVFDFQSGTILPGRSVVCLAAITPSRLRPYNLLGSLDVNSICKIPPTAISTSLLLCNVQDRTETPVCLQIVLNNNGTWVQ